MRGFLTRIYSGASERNPRRLKTLSHDRAGDTNTLTVPGGTAARGSSIQVPDRYLL